MKITKIDTFKAWVDWCNWLLVRIQTDEGISGWGEASLHGAVQSVETAIGEFGALLVGQDPAGPEQHWHRLYNSWRWRQGAVFMTALGALDIALWDIEAKRLGVPVYRLLGGAHRERLRAYASHWISGSDGPERAHELAREAVRRGFCAFKVSPFTWDRLRENEAGAISHALDVIAAAREGAGPDVEIFVECSELLSPRLAVRLDEVLAPYRPGWFEEPVPFENARVMAQLQRDLRTPIATGERLLSRFEYRELLEVGGCRVIQPDLMHAGGFTEVRRIAALADTWYIPVAPHNPGGPILTAASLHLAAAIPNFYILEQMEPQRPFRDRASIPALQIEKGHFILPQAPGLGLEPDLAMIQNRSFSPQPPYERRGSLWR